MEIKVLIVIRARDTFHEAEDLQHHTVLMPTYRFRQ